ncbi:hypothetical protein C8R47DRAFT_1194117 [Mycena vitilis]|nr:hypothetical protein C8R47DRAFT_1194117 [Mycena vitilis]
MPLLNKTGAPKAHQRTNPHTNPRSFIMLSTFMCLTGFGFWGSSDYGDGDAGKGPRADIGGQSGIVVTEPRRTTMLNVPVLTVKSPLAVQTFIVPEVFNAIKTGLLPTIVGIPSADDLALGLPVGLPAVKDEQNHRADSTQPVSIAPVQHGRQARSLPGAVEDATRRTVSSKLSTIPAALTVTPVSPPRPPRRTLNPALTQPPASYRRSSTPRLTWILARAAAAFHRRPSPTARPSFALRLRSGAHFRRTAHTYRSAARIHCSAVIARLFVARSRSRTAFEELIRLPDWHWLLRVSGSWYTPDDSFEVREDFTDLDIVVFFNTSQWMEVSQWLGPRYSDLGCAADKNAQRWEEVEVEQDAAAEAEDEDEDDGYDHWSDVVSLDVYHYGAWVIGEVEEGEDVWPDFVPVNYGE